MEFQRLILILALFVISFMLWNTWEREHAALHQSATITSTKIVNPSPSGNAIAAAQESIQSNLPPAYTINLQQPSPQRYITVQTDVLNVTIDKQGGNIVRVSLPQYPVSIDQPQVPFKLMNDALANYYVAESTLLGSIGPDTSTAPALYEASSNAFTLMPNQQKLDVILRWQHDGLKVNKIYSFNRNNYLINVHYQIDNQSQQTWTGKLFTQITRRDVATEQNGFFGIHPYVGAAISTPEQRYEEVSFKDLQGNGLDRNVPGGWIAMVQHYFLSAWVPPKTTENYHYYSQLSDGNIYTIGMTTKPFEVAPGTQKMIGSQLYAGPEIAEELKKIAPGLDLTVSYGWLWFISVIIFWLMKEIYKVVGNWGWAIVIVTILIKLIFYHLSAKSYQSMAKMRSLQPKIDALRESCGDDKQKLGQAMMALYKEEKVSPLGGCLPILVQIPVFFALYMVLIESVEFRHAPWILWIQDLSAQDPYFILPIIMGLTMFVQQKLSPAPADPTQAKVMMFLPLVFTLVFIQFPAGLVLYWAVNNILSILQQWYITYRFEHSAKVLKVKANAT